ncbi:MAG: hypothetical protein BalsKO_20340 [Balneolaceae bacterium]
MRLVELFEIIKSDVGASKKPLLLKFLKKFFLSNYFRLILNYRIGYYLNSKGNKFLCKFLKYRQIKIHSCQISYNCKIGKNLFLPHPIGIVIGDGVIIGDNVSIWQNVTLGSHGKNVDLKYPKIEDSVKIFANSMIIGGVVIGEGAKIGAMSLVMSNISSNKTAVGLPAKEI